MPDAPDTALVESYLQHLQTQRKLSGHTVENYQRDLMQLGELAREYKRPSLASLSTVDLRRVAAQLHARGMSPSSIARKLSAWRGFFGWMAIHHGLTINPVEGVKPRNARKPCPRLLAWMMPSNWSAPGPPTKPRHQINKREKLCKPSATWPCSNCCTQAACEYPN